MFNVDNFKFVLNNEEVDIETIINNPNTYIKLIYNNQIIIKLLLERNFDINYKVNNEYNMLMHAITNMDINAIEFLISNGADPNSEDTDGDNCLIRALCIRPTNRYSNEIIKILKILLDNGANINNMNYFRYTALIYAGSTYNKDIIKFLLDNGANPYIENFYGDSFISYIVDSEECFLVFLNHPSFDIYQIDMEGNTILTIACIFSKTNIIKLILNYIDCNI